MNPTAAGRVSPGDTPAGMEIGSPTAPLKSMPVGIPRSPTCLEMVAARAVTSSGWSRLPFQIVGWYRDQQCDNGGRLAVVRQPRQPRGEIPDPGGVSGDHHQGPATVVVQGELTTTDAGHPERLQWLVSAVLGDRGRERRGRGRRIELELPDHEWASLEHESGCRVDYQCDGRPLRFLRRGRRAGIAERGASPDGLFAAALCLRAEAGQGFGVGASDDERRGMSDLAGCLVR